MQLTLIGQKSGEQHQLPSMFHLEIFNTHMEYGGKIKM